MRIQSYNRFWQKIHLLAKKKGFLLRVMFELTYRCNFSCKHCYLPLSYRKYRELKTKDIIFILNQLRDIGCLYLGFTGGEPFMRKDIIKILGHAKRKGFELIIYTNGSLIEKKVAKELSLLNPNKVDITLPAMTKVAFEQITGVSGSHDKVFKAIELLYKNKVNLGFKTCLLKENEAEIKEIEDFAASLGALHRLDDMLSPRLDGSREPYNYRGTLTNKKELKECSSEFNSQINITKNHRSKLCSFFRCGVGSTQAAITPLGELKMCLMIDRPKYKIMDVESGDKSVNLKEVWQKLKEFIKNIKVDNNYQCNNCNLKPYCKWCPAQGWLWSRNFTSCTPESRLWARMRKHIFNGQLQH